MSLGRVLAQQEAAILDAQIGQLSECKFLSESDVVELAAKCKVRAGSRWVRGWLAAPATAKRLTAVQHGCQVQRGSMWPRACTHV